MQTLSIGLPIPIIPLIRRLLAIGIREIDALDIWLAGASPPALTKQRCFCQESGLVPIIAAVTEPTFDGTCRHVRAQAR